MNILNGNLWGTLNIGISILDMYICFGPAKVLALHSLGLCQPLGLESPLTTTFLSHTCRFEDHTKWQAHGEYFKHVYATHGLIFHRSQSERRRTIVNGWATSKNRIMNRICNVNNVNSRSQAVDRFLFFNFDSLFFLLSSFFQLESPPAPAKVNNFHFYSCCFFCNFTSCFSLSLVACVHILS